MNNKTLYLELGMGAAGDMLTAALLELLPDKEEFIKELNRLALPGVKYVAEPSEKCGICGTHMSVLIDGAEEDAIYDHVHEHEHGHEHSHEHDHDHGHGHHHHSMHEIEHIVAHFNISDKVKKDIVAVYGLIAQAESQVHGKPVNEIHFHEVGSLDAIADVAAVCLLMEKLNPARVLASPIHVGCGTVRCAHGLLPVPAPATANILSGLPVYGGRIQGELCTPTGAALLKHFVSEFGNMPVMSVDKIGYGMGKKDFEKANCVRAMLGTEVTSATARTGSEAGASTGAEELQDSYHDEIVELNCNLDDMTAEAVGFAMDQLLKAGAVDVFTTAITMKKSRPGLMLTVLCKADRKDRVVEAIFKHTTTIGIREKVCARYILKRELVSEETCFGPVRKKQVSGYGVNRDKYEYDDLAAIAGREGLSIAQVLEAIRAQKR